MPHILVSTADRCMTGVIIVKLYHNFNSHFRIVVGPNRIQKEHFPVQTTLISPLVTVMGTKTAQTQTLNTIHSFELMACTKERKPSGSSLVHNTYRYPKASIKSLKFTSVSLYPSRANAKTALGPSQTLPSMRGVKWTPRKGKFGSGT